MKLEIIFENEDYIGVHKPSGMLSIPDRHHEELVSVYALLTKKFGKIYTVHRIDRDTSGCLMFAKNENAHQHLNTLFSDRKVTKIYHALVSGVLPQTKGIINEAIMEHPVKKGKMMVHAKQGKPASTGYEVLESFGKISYVSCNLFTGRTHQIRVHLSNMGNPILCDAMYGLTNPVYVSSFKKNYNLSKLEEEEKPILSRLALHAYSLSFTDAQGHQVRLECPLPKDFNAVLKQCRKWL